MTFAVVELNDEGGYVILKQCPCLSDLTHISLDGYCFPSVFVSRDDLAVSLLMEHCIDDPDRASPALQDEIRAVQEQINAISDDDMERLCSKLQDHLVENGGYWDWLQQWLKDHNLTLPEIVSGIK